MRNIIRATLILLLAVTIDPLFSQVSIGWAARYSGGISGDVGLALTVDNNGNVYVTGNSYGNQTRQDLVVLKYSPAGTNLWTKRIADTVNNDFMSGHDIHLDEFSNVMVGGSGVYKYNSNGNLIWSNANVGSRKMSLDNAGNTINMTGQTFYITKKVNSGGTLVWERIYPSYQFNYNHVPTDICVDKEQNVLVTGRSRDTAVVLYDYATVKYSNTGDLIWERRYNGGNEDQAYAIACDDSNNVYVTGWNKNISTDILTIKYSPEGDTVWKSVYDGGGGDVGYDIEVDSLGYVYVAGVTLSNSYVTLKYAPDGKLMWSRVQMSSQYPYLPKIKLDKNRNVYMSFVSYRPGQYSNYAVVKYNNDGVQQWIGVYNNNGNSNFNYIYDMTVDSKPNASIYVTGKSGGSMATVTFVQTPTATNPISYAVPDEFNLEQNYPNPFNPSTTIRFDVRTSGNVTLKVFDVLGREVRAIVNEFLKSGSYSVQFSGDNLPSGVYYYELMAGSFSETKRMVLVK
jgi:hypothetical protein